MTILFLVSSFVFPQVQSEPETFPYIKLTDNLYKIEVAFQDSPTGKRARRETCGQRTTQYIETE